MNRISVLGWVLTGSMVVTAGLVSAALPTDVASIEQVADGGQGTPDVGTKHARNETEMLVRLHREAIGQYVAGRTDTLPSGCCEVAHVAR